MATLDELQSAIESMDVLLARLQTDPKDLAAAEELLLYRRRPFTVPTGLKPEVDDAMRPLIKAMQTLDAYPATGSAAGFVGAIREIRDKLDLLEGALERPLD